MSVDNKGAVRNIKKLLILMLIAITLAATPHADASINPDTWNGKYIIEVMRDGQWQQAGSFGFDQFFSERTLDIASPKSNEVRLRISKEGGGLGHFDSVLLGGNGPVEVVDVPRGVHKLGATDNDVIDSGESTEMVFAASSTGKLTLNARIEPVEIAKTPFVYPTSNVFKESSEWRQFYVYEQGTGKMDELFFAAFWPTGSGHPDGITYGWVHSDDKNLYVKIDFTSDNTVDGLKDYAAVNIRTPQGIKRFQVSEGMTNYGVPHFTYTDKVTYEHKVYEFAIPLGEIGLAKDEPMLLAFETYGTSFPGLCDTAGTCYVDKTGDGSDCTLAGATACRTITGAIYNVGGEGTIANIIVGPGVYGAGDPWEYFPLNIPEGARLIGAGDYDGTCSNPLATCIDGNGTAGPVVRFTSPTFYPDVRILNGFIITGGDTGINITGTFSTRPAAPLISNTTINGNNNDGIKISAASTTIVNSSIINTRIYNSSGNGIHIDANSNTTFYTYFKNVHVINTLYNGIYMDNNSGLINSTLQYVDIVNAGNDGLNLTVAGGTGTTLISDISNTTVKDSGRHGVNLDTTSWEMGFYPLISNSTVSGSGGHGVYLNAHNTGAFIGSTIINSAIVDNIGNGIDVKGGWSTKIPLLISDNYINNNYKGIYINSPNNSTLDPIITWNTIAHNNSDGLVLDVISDTMSSIIDHNDIINSQGDGILLAARTNSTLAPIISRTLITDSLLNGISMHFYGAFGSGNTANVSPTIFNSTINANMTHGVYIQGANTYVFVNPNLGTAVNPGLNTIISPGGSFDIFTDNIDSVSAFSNWWSTGVPKIGGTGSGNVFTGDPNDEPLFVSMIPTSGSSSGGTVITITNTSIWTFFVDSAGAKPDKLEVLFNGTPATVTNVTNTTVTATAPSRDDAGGACSATVTVVNPGGQTGTAGTFSYTAGFGLTLGGATTGEEWTAIPLSISGAPAVSTLTYTWEVLSTSPTSVIGTVSGTITANLTASAVPAAGGSVSVRVTATDQCGATGTSNTHSVSFTDKNGAPSASAGADQSVNEGASVTLSGSGADSDTDGSITAYKWTQTAGTTVSLAGATSASATFTAPSVGVAGETLTFTLTVTDDRGGTGSDTVDVMVNNVNTPPVAIINAPASADEGIVVSMDGLASTDAEGTTLTYAWQQTGGTSVTITNALTAAISFTAPEIDTASETLTFELTVTDDSESTDTAIANITINDIAYTPEAPVLLTPEDGATGISNITILKWAESTDENPADTVSYNVFVCTDSSFSGCSAPINDIAISAISTQTASASGAFFFAGSSMALMAAMVLGASTRRRRALALMLVMGAMVLMACGQADTDGKTEVRLALGDGSRGALAIPAEVATVEFIISAPDLRTMYRSVDVAAGTSDIAEVFEVVDGANRKFEAFATDAAGQPIYDGVTVMSLAGGEVTVDITMGHSTATGELAYLLKGLVPEQAYYWRVEATDGILSTMSEVSSFTVAREGTNASGTAIEE